MGDLHLHLDDDPAAAVEGLVRGMTHRRFLGEHADHDLAEQAARAWAARVLPRARRFRVRDLGAAETDDLECGHVWVAVGDGDLSVLALTLDDPALAPTVRARLLDLARQEGLRRLTAGVAPGDPVLEAFVQGGAFEVSAIQMRLDLDHTLPPEPGLELRPFDDADFEAFEADEIESYAEAREKAGETHETALRVSREQHAELLPHGLATEHHHFFTGWADGEEVGTLWLGTERPMAFVYDVVVLEEQRRRGHGAALMRAAALWSRDQGRHAIGLNVFGYNHGAKALYDGLGFHVVERFVAHTL